MDAQNLPREIKQLFTEHPQGTGESYAQHLWFTAKMSARFVQCGVLLLIHGLFPFLLTHAVSDRLDGINRIFAKRNAPQESPRTGANRSPLGWDS